VLIDQFLISGAIFFTLHLAGRPFLGLPYYASLLIPSMALALGPPLRDPLARLTPAAFGSVVAVALLAVALTFATGPGAHVTRLGERSFAVPWIVLATALGVLKLRTNTVTLAIAMCAFAATNVMTRDGEAFGFANSSRRSHSFGAIARADEVLREADTLAEGRFWYDRGAPLGDVFQAIASTRLWGYRLIGDRFPSFVNPLSGQDTTVEAGERLILLGEDGTRAVEAARASLSRLGLDATVVGRRAIVEGDVRFELVLLETTIPSALLESPPVPVSPDAFQTPLQSGGAQSVEIDTAGNRVRVLTNLSTHDWQVISESLGVQPARRYVARFDLTVLRGGAGVHIIVPQAGNKLLASRYWCRSIPPATQYLSFDTQQFDRVAIVLSNCGVPVPVASEFRVGGLSMMQYRPH
jgi:hypothetical protein